MTEKLKGKVKRFNSERGWGFIESRGEPDIFVHYSAIQMEGFKILLDGDEVEFDMVQDARGPKAENVVVIKPAQEAKQATPYPQSIYE